MRYNHKGACSYLKQHISNSDRAEKEAFLSCASELASLKPTRNGLGHSKKWVVGYNEEPWE